MSTGDELLAAIYDNPLDDTLRLVYADWLDEQATESRPCDACRGSGWAFANAKGEPQCPNCIEPTASKRVVRQLPNKDSRFRCLACKKVWHAKKCSRCKGDKVLTSKKDAERAELIRAQISLDSGAGSRLERDVLASRVSTLSKKLMPSPRTPTVTLAFVRGMLVAFLHAQDLYFTYTRDDAPDAVGYSPRYVQTELLREFPEIVEVRCMAWVAKACNYREDAEWLFTRKAGPIDNDQGSIPPFLFDGLRAFSRERRDDGHSILRHGRWYPSLHTASTDLGGVVARWVRRNGESLVRIKYGLYV